MARRDGERGPVQTATLVEDVESLGKRRGPDERQEFRIRVDDAHAPTVTAADRRRDGADRQRFDGQGNPLRWNLLRDYVEDVGALAAEARVDIDDLAEYLAADGPNGIGADALPPAAERRRLCHALQLDEATVFPLTYNPQPVDRDHDRVVERGEGVELPSRTGLTAEELRDVVDAGARARRIERIETEIAAVKRQRDIHRRGEVADAGHQLIRTVKQSLRNVGQSR